MAMAAALSIFAFAIPDIVFEPAAIVLLVSVSVFVRPTIKSQELPLYLLISPVSVSIKIELAGTLVGFVSADTIIFLRTIIILHLLPQDIKD